MSIVGVSMRPRKLVLLALGAGVCGLVCNLLPYTLRDGVHLYWGGAFAAMVSLALGPVHGLLAALISQLPALWVGQHWLFVANSAMQAFFVGYVARRAKDWHHGEGVFWVAVAGPLLTIGFYFALPIHPVQAWAILLLSPLEALLNVSVAVIVLNLMGEPAILGHSLELSHIRTIRLQLLSGMIVAAIIPFTFLTMEHAKETEKSDKTQAMRRLQELAQHCAREMEIYLSQHRSAVISAAVAMEDGGWKDPVKAQELLARHHRIYGGLLTMLQADASGLIKASNPLFDKEGRRLPMSGIYVSDREYFLQPKQTGRSYISGAFRGRGFGSDPIVAVSAPVRDNNGKFAGVVEGSLNLERFHSWAEELERRDGVRTILIDQNGNAVFASTASGLNRLDPVRGAQLAALQDEARHLSYAAPLASQNWRLIVLRPIGQFLDESAKVYRRTAIWTLAAILLAIVLVHFAGQFVNAPIEAVVRNLRAMPMDAPQPVQMALPRGAPREIVGLAQNLEIMSAGMAESYRGMRESLEERIRLNEELTRLFGELKQKAADLTQAKLQAEEANHAKTAFLANISHEIRTPMNGLMGMLAILQDSPMNEDQHRRVQLAQDSASSLLALMNDLLTFSPADGASAEVARVEFVPATLVEGIYNTYQHRCVDRGVQMSMYVDPAARELYVGDPARLSQVLTQIVNNAIKFTHRGSVRIALLGKEKTDAGCQFRFEVSDTGIGVPEALQTHIFEPFTQADSSLTRRHGGTGIGLAVCKKIVSALGGTVGMRSAEGIGSVFWFQVPLIRLKKSPDAVAPAAASVASPPVPQKPRILIVEDNAVNQKVASRLVERGGFDYDIAENGKVALECLESNAFHAILMDCQMPEMDGYRATKEIRRREKNGQHIPIIAMTAHAMEGDRERCLDAGMDDYLTKPVNRQELLSVLERWIGKNGASSAIRISEAGTSPPLPMPTKQ
ncbi:MAG: response regulator [Bryobacterales bacterium]|nr:response regulator [Bryobacterales bacterium]